MRRSVAGLLVTAVLAASVASTSPDRQHRGSALTLRKHVAASGGGVAVGPPGNAALTVGQAAAGRMSGNIDATIGFWTSSPIVVASPEAGSPGVPFALQQNRPNPFNPRTVISFSLAEESDVVLRVHDVTGRQVATLVESRLPAGEHSVEFQPRHLASGVYFYRITAGSFEATRRLTLLK